MWLGKNLHTNEDFSECRVVRKNGLENQHKLQFSHTYFRNQNLGIKEKEINEKK